MGLPALTIYGVGDILGAGIYGLVGAVAAIAGSATWISFLITILIAALTALSYSELGSRFPRSAGEAHYCQIAFGKPALALLIGWMVLASGVVSLSTVTLIAAKYALAPWDGGSPLARNALLVIFLFTLAAITFWGIRQSSAFNIVCTAVEVSGLFIVVGVGLFYLIGAEPTPARVETGEAGPSWLAILQGSSLAFYAFIGFEDMVNVAEEVKSPRRNLPIAILTALGVAGVMYVLVSWVATNVVPPAELARAEGPLIDVVARAAPRFPAEIFSLIALLAVANTGLLNFVMGSRLLYGMARQGLLPSWLGTVHASTRTPHWSIALILVFALALALSGSVTFLAGTTNVLLLTVFFAVNASLIAIRRRRGADPEAFSVPLFVPVGGMISCLVLIVFIPPSSLWTAAIIIVIGIAIVAVRWERLSMAKHRLEEGDAEPH